MLGCYLVLQKSTKYIYIYIALKLFHFFFQFKIAKSTLRRRDSSHSERGLDFGKFGFRYIQIGSDVSEVQL